MTTEAETNQIEMPTVATTTRREPSLNVFDITLQAMTVAMLIATIVAVQARWPHYHYLVVAPILSIGLWACAGLIIDRQALVGQEPGGATTKAGVRP